MATRFLGQYSTFPSLPPSSTSVCPCVIWAWRRGGAGGEAPCAAAHPPTGGSAECFPLCAVLLLLCLCDHRVRLRSQNSPWAVHSGTRREGYLLLLNIPKLEVTQSTNKKKDFSETPIEWHCGILHNSEKINEQ